VPVAPEDERAFPATSIEEVFAPMNDFGLPWWERAIPGLGATPKAIGLALAVIAVAWLIMRTVPPRIERGLLRPQKLDAGMRYAVARVFEYLLIVIAAILVLGNLGIDLSSITLLISALGVGIGFGLQTTVSNFFSGLVLLFEQPIRVGDRISLGALDTDALGGVNGYVTKIGLRATMVETLDGITIVVPNNELVSKPVVNWSLGDPRLRVRVRFSVSYDTPPARVRDVLERASRDISGVLAEPAPQVRLVETGESSLVFQVLVWIDDARQRGLIETALREAGVLALRAAGIEIPFPQRVVKLEGAPR